MVLQHNPNNNSDTTATEATNTLGLRLLQSTPSETNALVSPLSIQSALSMAFTGANGVTAKQMAQTLGLSTKTASEIVQLTHSIATNTETTTLLIANALFGQKSYPFIPEFISQLEKEFKAPLQILDFQQNPAESTNIINQWIKNKTRQHITQLIPPNSISRDTSLVLANAIYFQATWLEKFCPSETRPANFTLPNGQACLVPTMRLNSLLHYTKFPRFESIALPYSNNDFFLVILLPGQTENLPQIEKKLSTSDFSSVFQSDKKRIAFALPSFRLEPATMVLAETLAQLGMPSAFDKPRGSADFSKIGPRLPNDYLFLSNVFHKAFISINESGTEAAAATATIMMRATALPPEPDLEVKIDRPFLFALLHKPSLAFLFLGRVLDPREKN